jgi:hypothetical protein
MPSVLRKRERTIDKPSFRHSLSSIGYRDFMNMTQPQHRRFMAFHVAFAIGGAPYSAAVFGGRMSPTPSSARPPAP